MCEGMTMKVARINIVCMVFVVSLFSYGLLPAVQGENPVVSDEAYIKELALVKGVVPECSKKTTCEVSTFRADFDEIKSDVFERWEANGTSEVGGKILTANGALLVSSKPSNHVVCRGLRTVEPVVAVPRISRGHFKVTFDVDTAGSTGGTILIRPQKSDAAMFRSQIRLQYSRDFKTGALELFIDEVSQGKFFVPLIDSYEFSISLGFDGIALFDSLGKSRLKTDLPSWATKGSSHYLTIGVMSTPVVDEEMVFEVSEAVISYPRRMSAQCPVYFCKTSQTIIDDLFLDIDPQRWEYWTEGQGKVNTVVPTSEGLKGTLEVADDELNPWGRMGLVTKEPVVNLPKKDGFFTVVTLVLDTTFTSGARMAFVKEPVEKVWGTEHIRFGMERRGFYCQGWIGDDGNLDALFDLPLSDEVEASIIIGRHGVYFLDPSCQVVGAFQRPKWSLDFDGLYLILYGQASRPGESVSFLYKSLEVITDFCPAQEVSRAPTHKSSSPAVAPAEGN
jgi:hypothetical protein